ncbi:MAG: hypothetical protein I3273_01975 [Candidatus Moeniiplasma glomeromycotorum]|nr:hypothetical protein [Candidatus Moeniiplasma glomeromycotorum]MCE8167113.1 hypothetical protein [Candidatus Moeniiplasma glomeromycotorum]MCE8168875.1 hypothetical protein [Candidatus Moeniiplasma glomeromycotorum]
MAKLNKVNKKTTATINRRVRHILKRESGKILEIQKPENDKLSADFRVNRRVKKGGVKYEVKPTSRELKVDQKVKNWREKQAIKGMLKRETGKPRNCQKCESWNDGCHCDCIQKVSSQILVKEINRRLKKGKY